MKIYSVYKRYLTNLTFCAKSLNVRGLYKSRHYTCQSILRYCTMKFWHLIKSNHTSLVFFFPLMDMINWFIHSVTTFPGKLENIVGKHPQMDVSSWYSTIHKQSHIIGVHFYHWGWCNSHLDASTADGHKKKKSVQFDMIHFYCDTWIN